MTDKEKVCLVPGSFDPATLGHRFLAKEASRKYGKVLCVAFINPEKEYTFSVDERLALMRAQFEGIENVSVDFSNGMLADFCSEHGVSVILKGYRNEKDREYELWMAEENKKRFDGAVTELVRSPDSLLDVSSTAVREILASGGDASHLLGEQVAALARDILKNR